MTTNELKRNKFDATFECLIGIDYHYQNLLIVVPMFLKASISIGYLYFFFFFGFALHAQDGESLFKSKCTACHQITNKKLIGPGLANIQEKRSKEWFRKFVASSQTFIKSGDAEAKKIFEEFNNIVMPDHLLSDAELDAIYEYIKSVSPQQTDMAIVEPEVKELPFNPSDEDIAIGRFLFTGKQRFSGGGPSCISCHLVQDDLVIAGGGLAKDLSDVYDRLGKTGIHAMVTALPFPQMKSSYQNKPITDGEALQLTAYLKNVSKERYYQLGTSYQILLLTWGIIGSIILMGIFPMFWYNRKKESVNKRIYERQIKSKN